MAGVGFGPAPDGFREVRYGPDGMQRGSLDKREEARAARQKDLAASRKREDAVADPMTQGQPGSETSVDAFDLAIAAIVAGESYRVRGLDISLDTPEKRAARNQEWREEQRAKTKAVLDKVDQKLKDEEEDPYSFEGVSDEEAESIIERDDDDEAFASSMTFQ